MHTSDAWRDLMTQLRDDIPELVTRFLATLETHGIYDEDTVDMDDLRHTAHHTMTLLIRRLAEEAPTPEEVEFVDQLGKRRARQGLPLDLLLEAVRLDFRIIWGLMRERAGDEHAELLVDRVEWLMTVVETYVSDVQRSFLHELATLQHDSRLATERHLGRLLNATAPSAQLAADIGRELRVDPHATFELVSIAPHGVERVQHEHADLLSSPGILSVTFRESLIIFRTRRGIVSSWVNELRDVPAIHVDHVTGLQHIPKTARALTRVHRITPDLNHFAELQELWPRIAADTLTGLLPDYFAGILAPLTDLTEPERERLTETLAAYLDTGEVKTTAERLGCHRNTVVNRLKQFEALTGLDVTVPREAALATVLCR